VKDERVEQAILIRSGSGKERRTLGRITKGWNVVELVKDSHVLEEEPGCALIGGCLVEVFHLLVIYIIIGLTLLFKGSTL
jgi:hypothetical protein